MSKTEARTRKSAQRSQKRILSRRTDMLWRLGALAVLWVVVFGRSCVFRPQSTYPGAHFNRGTNTAWLAVEWVSQPHRADEILTLSLDLAERQITTIYVYTSYYKPEGNFNPTYAHAKEFVTVMKGFAPDLIVQAWIGLPLDTMNLGSRAVRRDVVDFCVTLMQNVGFDGLHIDPEPVEDGDKSMLALLDEMRQALNPEAILSIAGRRIWPIFPTIRWPFVGRWCWGTSYYQKVARHVDEIAVMVYDSALPTSGLYRYWTKFQVIALSRALAYSDVRLFIGIPTSEETTSTHKPAAENMRSGLRGTIDGLNDWATWTNVVTGIAIYPYWETDAREWETYRSLWLGE